MHNKKVARDIKLVLLKADNLYLSSINPIMKIIIEPIKTYEKSLSKNLKKKFNITIDKKNNASE